MYKYDKHFVDTNFTSGNCTKHRRPNVARSIWKKYEIYSAPITKRTWVTRSDLGPLNTPDIFALQLALGRRVLSAQRVNVVQRHDARAIHGRKSTEQTNNHPHQLHPTHYSFITQRRSVLKNDGCFQRRLFVCMFVCQDDNFRTSKHRMMKLGG